MSRCYFLRPAHLCSFAPPHTCLTSPAPSVSPPAAPPLVTSVCRQSVSFSRPHVSPVFLPSSRLFLVLMSSFVLTVLYCWNYLDYLYRQLFSLLPFGMFGSPRRFSSFIKASLFVVNLPVSAFQLVFVNLTSCNSAFKKKVLQSKCNSNPLSRWFLLCVMSTRPGPLLSW